MRHLELIRKTPDRSFKHAQAPNLAAFFAALKQHRVGAFFLGGKGRSRWDIIQQVVRNWPRMNELADRTARPFAF